VLNNVLPVFNQKLGTALLFDFVLKKVHGHRLVSMQVHRTQRQIQLQEMLGKKSVLLFTRLMTAPR